MPALTQSLQPLFNDLIDSKSYFAAVFAYRFLGQMKFNSLNFAMSSPHPSAVNTPTCRVSKLSGQTQLRPSPTDSESRLGHGPAAARRQQHDIHGRHRSRQRGSTGPAAAGPRRRAPPPGRRRPAICDRAQRRGPARASRPTQAPFRGGIRATAPLVFPARRRRKRRRRRRRQPPPSVLRARRTPP